MAKRILAVSPCTSNPVSPIAYLIHAALQQRCQHSSDSHKEYQQTLATLVGLGFTAILSEGSRIESCKSHFDFCLQFREFIQGTDNPVNLAALSVSIAEIVCSAIYPFKVLGFPRYYDDFMLAMTHALTLSDTVSLDTKNRVQEILLELLEKCG